MSLFGFALFAIPNGDRLLDRFAGADFALDVCLACGFAGGFNQWHVGSPNHDLRGLPRLRLLGAGDCAEGVSTAGGRTACKGARIGAAPAFCAVADTASVPPMFVERFNRGSVGAHFGMREKASIKDAPQ